MDARLVQNLLGRPEGPPSAADIVKWNTHAREQLAIMRREDRLRGLIDERSDANKAAGASARRGMAHLREAEAAALERRHQANAAALEEKRRKDAASRITNNSLIFKSDLDTLARLSSQYVDERVGLGIVPRSGAQKLKGELAGFWRKAHNVSLRIKPDADGDRQMANMIILRNGDKNGTPVGFLKFGLTKTMRGQVVLHLSDAFIEPQYRIRGGEPLFPRPVVRALRGIIKMVRETNDLPDSAVVHLTYDPRLSSAGTRKGTVETVMTPPLFWMDEPKPNVSERVRAIRLHPDQNLPLPFDIFAHAAPSGIPTLRERTGVSHTNPAVDRGFGINPNPQGAGNILGASNGPSSLNRNPGRGQKGNMGKRGGGGRRR
ncbi:MAG: hypothetical protein HY394_00285 [Candidatus Diapherotrites archaeon]|nr:hypothetical protein [Candidatus Diapherotrites archaeon]